jgi:hypothetical protein
MNNNNINPNISNVKPLQQNIPQNLANPQQQQHQQFVQHQLPYNSINNVGMFGLNQGMQFNPALGNNANLWRGSLSWVMGNGPNMELLCACKAEQINNSAAKLDYSGWPNVIGMGSRLFISPDSTSKLMTIKQIPLVRYDSIDTFLACNK